jgi:hypothetical protein
MSKHNNIYNILGKLSALEPKPEPTKSILGELAIPSKSDFARHLNERYLSEKDKSMSRAAKGYEKYGKQGMEALAKAGREGKDLEKIRDKYNKYDESVTEGEVDEDMLSPKQQKIAKMSPPPDKIDANDLAALRAGKSKEKEGNEFSGELAKAKAQHKDSFSVDGKEYPVKEGNHPDMTDNDDPNARSNEPRTWPKGTARPGRYNTDTKKVSQWDHRTDSEREKDWDTMIEDEFDPANRGEYDREGEMADQDLETAQDAAEELRSILDADENLPEWVQAKITKAVDYLDTARDYMQSKDQEPDLQEGWDDMMKSVKDRAEQGTGKFDKQTTSTGTRYTRKADTFADAGDDGETKASDAPKKKGRPKKNTGPERVTAKAYKHKGGRVSESVKLDTFVEDTLAEMDAMLTITKSVAQPQKFMGMVSESILLENTLQAIEHRYGKEVRDFMETGDMDDDLYHALYDYYFDDMPYGVKKARDGDPYEWIGDRFFDEMGGAGYLNRKNNSNGIEESGALHPGQVVYYRGQRGEIDRIEGNKCFVHVGDGDMDVWPTNSCSTDKQSFMSTMKNDIKDIGYGMKGFLTGGPETRELDELAKLAGLGQQKLGEASCNMTAEGEMCAKHGMAECWSSSMYESKSEKPDFLDMDKDGDKKEPMKKAVKDKELDESKPDFLDMDKDGDKEEPMKKAIGDKRNPFARAKTSNAFTQTAPYPSFKKKNPVSNKKEELDECDMPSNMSPMGGMAPEAESGMNINSSMDTKTGRKTLSVTADGAAAEQLAQMLKMAGMAGGHSHEAEPDHHKVVLVRPAMQDMEQPMEEEYANDPNEQYIDNDALMNQGQDLNRKKKQYAGMPKLGDNPMATEDAVRLEDKLAKLYDSIKVRN